ncbi:MAG: deoxyribose-phosphate aldolase [Microbacter sp.]
MKDFHSFFQSYDVEINDDVIRQETLKLIAEKRAENDTKEVYKQCFNFIDLTSLNTTDHRENIEVMVDKVNHFSEYFQEMPSVAAICVFPNFAGTVSQRLQIPIGIAAVSAGFPSSQTFIEVKVAETLLAVHEGATEIDVVISVGDFLKGDYEKVYDELVELKASCRNAHFKVILETGALMHAIEIKKASLLAMEAGADFIKTSTGKMNPAATTEAAYVMCSAIREYYKKTGKKVGFKPAGGIVTKDDAVNYYTIVKEILGVDWLNNQLFRFGASRLANNLLTSIYDQETNYF